MKIFNKGQIVIPIQIRKTLGIATGDMLDVEIDEKNESLTLKKPDKSKAHMLAGSLAKYKLGKKHPTKKDLTEALRDGFAGKKHAH